TPPDTAPLSLHDALPIYSAGRASVSSVHNLKTVFFDDRVGEHFFRNVLELFLGLVTAPAIEIQNEKLALPDITHGGVTKPREGRSEEHTSELQSRGHLVC